MADDESNTDTSTPADSGGTVPPAPAAPQGDALDQGAMALYQQHKASFTDPVKPVPPAKPSPRPQGFGKTLGDFFGKVASGTNNTLNAVGRGLVDAVNDASDTTVGLGGVAVNAAIEGAQKATGDKTIGSDWEKWYNSGDTSDINPLRVSDSATDEMFGKKQGGVYQFVQNATTFTAALETGNEASGVMKLAPGAIKTLARVGIVGLTQAAVVDPRAKRLSDLLEDGAPSLANPLTQWLKSDGKDSEALARLKSGLEGTMTAVAIDKFVGGVASVVRDIRAGAAAAATPELDAAIQKAAEAKPDAVSAVPTPDGGATIVHNPPATRTLYRVEPSTLADKSAEAEAASRKALGPEYYAQVESEKGRLFSDVPREEYGHGTPDHTTYSVQVPEAAVESFGRDHGTLGKEYLLPQELADTKTPLGADGKAVTPSTAPVQSGLVFDSMADAESHAAAINESVRAESIPAGHVDDQDVAALKEAVAGAKPGAKFTDIVPRGVFNYNYFGGTEAMQATIESLATKLEHAFPGLRNVVAGAGDTGNELTVKAVQMAQQGDADSWLGQARSDADVLHAMPARQLARKIMVKQMAGKIAELSQAADMNPGNLIAHNNLKALGDQLLHLFGETASIDSGAGRLLQSLKNGIPGDTPASLTEALTTADWQGMARQIRLSEGDPSLIMDSMLNKVGQRAAENDPSKWDLFNSFRVNMLMSGPKTSIVLATSQAIASIEAPLEYWMGGVIKGNTALRQQGADMLSGLWHNAGAAWKTAAKAFKLGQPILEQHGIVADTGQETTAGGAWGFLGKLMQVPSRVVMTVDEFYRNLNYLNSVRGLSMRAANEDLQNMGPMSLKDAADYKAQKLAQDLQSATDVNGRAMNPVALSYAKDATFSTPMSGFGKTIADARQEHPALKVVLPFWNTPYNLARYAWQRTPVLGALAGDMRADIAAGGERQAVALGKQAAGAAIWGSAAMFAVSGNMTGAGPTDPGLRKQWTNAGNQPYSIRIPGTNEWISYRRIDQLGTPLSMVADITEMSGHLRQTDVQNVYAKFGAALSADLLSKTFLGGMANFFDAVHSGDPDKVMTLMESTAGSVIPAAARQFDSDDRYREVRGMIDALKQRVPGLSSTLEPKRNILGEPVMKPPGYFNANMNPFTLTPGGRVDAVQDALVQLGHGMAMPDDHINALDLTDRKMWKRSDGKLQSPYDRMLELMAYPKDGGDSLRQQLTDLINSDDWKNATDPLTDPTGVRRITASRIIQGSQKEAMGEMVDEYPGLEDAIEEAKGMRKAALEAPVSNAPTPWTGTGNRIDTKAPQFIQ